MKHHPANANGVYDLSTMKAPQLSGFLLKLFTWLAEMFPSLAKFTGKDTGIYTLRRLETKEPPTYYPFCPQSYLEACKKQKGMSIEDAIKILGSINTKRAFPCSIDYHLAYLSLKITPAQVCKVLIETLEADLTQSVPLCPMNKFDQADILKQAEASAKRYADKQPLGPLDGVPIAIKDEMDALPYKTDVGTSFLGHLPTRDAVVVERLRKAGAIIIGKTNMHEFGLDVTGCNPHGGTSRNPYNINRFPGGSSSGSAVAVAAGFCPIAIGADGGGSIRIPAAYNGIYGLKATSGRISTVGSFPCAPTVGVVGPMASSAYDLALSYMITAGPSPQDPKSLMQPPPTIESFAMVESLADLRLGVFWPHFNDAVNLKLTKHPDIVKKCTKMLDQMAALGAQIVEIEIPDLSVMRVSHAAIITSEIADATKSLDRSKMTFPTRSSMTVFEHSSAKDFISACRFKTRGMNHLREIFKLVDVIVSPTTAIVAPEIPKGALSDGLFDYTTSAEAMKYIFTANFLGNPAVSCPIGYDSKKMPIGIQFQAKWWNEDVLLRMANVCEKLSESILEPPKVFYPNISF